MTKIVDLVKWLPFLRAFSRRGADDGNKAKEFVPSGHFYSPIPSLEEVKRDEARIFDRTPSELGGVELSERSQIALLDELKPYYDEMPFGAELKDGLRYFFENDSYSYSDAIFLHCMIRRLQPRRIVEVGSGYSSCVTLDTNELFFENRIECTFVDPYPQLLLSLIKDADKRRIQLVAKRLQDLDLGRFMELSAGDILFIDSTHVSKTDSDVNYALFEILPSLRPGVYIHFHDIFFPFEYPKHWVYEGRAWNEDYMLRAFLQYNHKFEIVLWNSYLFRVHKDELLRRMPLAEKNPGGSLWLRKIE